MGMPNWNRRNNFGFDEDEISPSQTDSDCSEYVKTLKKLRQTLANKNKLIEKLRKIIFKFKKQM